MNATARRVLSLALLVYALYDLSDPGRGSLLAGVDLAIHETGHLVLGPFGEFIGFAGGTLFQLIMPMAFVIYFVRHGDRHAASVALWWAQATRADVGRELRAPLVRQMADGRQASGRARTRDYTDRSWRPSRCCPPPVRDSCLGVPTAIPVWVSRSPRSSSIASAMPKSATFPLREELVPRRREPAAGPQCHFE